AILLDARNAVIGARPHIVVIGAVLGRGDQCQGLADREQALALDHDDHVLIVSLGAGPTSKGGDDQAGLRDPGPATKACGFDSLGHCAAPVSIHARISAYSGLSSAKIVAPPWPLPAVLASSRLAPGSSRLTNS